MTIDIEILQFLHYHPLANRTEIMAGLRKLPVIVQRTAKNTFYSVKYMNLQEQRNKNNFVVVNNVYLHKID